MSEQQTKKKGLTKKQRSHHFKEPRKRKVKVGKRNYTCNRCGKDTRTNAAGKIAWHRKGSPKWCPLSGVVFPTKPTGREEVK